MKEEQRYSLYLLIVTIFWGSSYVLTKICLQSVGEFHIITFRFFISFLLTFPILYKKMRPISKESYVYSFVLALILFLVFITMNFGLRHTTASNAGFLIGLPIIFIPFFSWMIDGEKPDKAVIFALVPGILGISLLSLGKNLTIHRGDMLCLLCSLLFAFHVVLTGRFVKKAPALSLGVLQFFYLSIFSILFQLPLEGFLIPRDISFWVSIFILSVFCTAIGYLVQGICQQKISATITGFIFVLEPVFSAMLGYFLLGEILSLQKWFGASILFCTVLWVTLRENGLGKL